jgi:predicted ATPase
MTGDEDMESAPEAAALVKPEALEVITPSITFDTLTFSDGTELKLDDSDIIVFVGPNNAGKSEALRELYDRMEEAGNRRVITSAAMRRSGTAADVLGLLEKHTRKIETADDQIQYRGLGFTFVARKVENYWAGNLSVLRPLFLHRVLTETRITDSQPAEAINTVDQAPARPIQLLFVQPEIERRLSGYFNRAFGQDLILFRAGGNQWPLLVGKRPLLESGEDMYSTDYNKRLLASTIPLAQQGDGMRSFASVLLQLLAPTTASILLLDEPEAFLHPPQARLLGEFIAKEKPKHAQLFIATHSADVLQGLLNAAPEHLRIVRIQRDGNVNRVKELDKARTKAIGADPLMKFSNVLSGIFYQRVIIGESDADCMFYSAILDLPAVHGELQPDVLFIHAGGKHRMAALAAALRALDVDVDIITDMDVIQDADVLERMVLALGGDWLAIKVHADALRTAIEQRKAWLDSEEVRKEITAVLSKAPATGVFPKELRSDIENVFRKASPWDAIKNAGDSIIPSGQPTTHYNELLKLCGQIGLWIVPVGEQEGFCKSIGGHGPRWVQDVIEKKDLANDPELARARGFIEKLWKRKAMPAVAP